MKILLVNQSAFRNAKLWKLTGFHETNFSSPQNAGIYNDNNNTIRTTFTRCHLNWGSRCMHARSSSNTDLMKERQREISVKANCIIKRDKKLNFKKKKMQDWVYVYSNFYSYPLSFMLIL